jgi:anti-sigma28 factor (negative regulator of flagellin synthesis)
MAMKIDSSGFVDPRVEQNRRPTADAAQDKAAQTGVAASNASATKAPTPAVSVQINATASLATSRSVDKSVDTKLLDEIRSKVAAGEFEINYDKVAESILGDAIASAMRRAG